MVAFPEGATISTAAPHQPTVAAVIVATDGRAWLPDLLRALADQTRRPDLVVAVDNASRDGSRDLLIDALGPDRVILADVDVGFPQAVAMGVDAVPTADHVLILHDDLVPDPDMLETLLDALEADPRLALVGPKLVDHDDPEILRSVGMTIDRFGRIDPGLEEGERDQGQHDAITRPLAVSSAAMLVRRHVFVGLGGFDRRFRLFRDDLDFCWRCWTAGWEVAAVPRARARHRRAAQSHARPGQTAFKGPRFYLERNTLAAILKNVPGWRLPVAVVVFVLTAAVRAVWYLLTRRFADALQTVRGWGWNLRRLPGTMRRRREVKSHRRVAPDTLNPLFSHLGPQLRQVVSGLLDQVVGGELDVDDPVATDDEASRSVVARAVRFGRRRPAVTVAVGMLVVGTIVSIPVLAPGVLRLGQVEPFPSSGLRTVEDYLSVWHDAGAAGTRSTPSPAQAVLGILQIALFNSEWLVSRALVIGSVLLAWLVALRAVAPLAPTRGPRVAAATVYVLSPVSLAAVRTGRLGAIATMVALPAAALALHLVVSRRAESVSAWRGVAGAILALAVSIAFEPAMVVPAVGVLVVLLLLVATRRDGADSRRGAVTRLLTVALGTAAVLFPWSTGLLDVRAWWPTSTLVVDQATSPTWAWLLQGPDQVGFAGPAAGIGVVAAGLFGLLFSLRRRPVLATSLALVAIAGGVGAVLLDGMGVQARVWPGMPLLLAAAALAGLFAMGLRSVGLVLAGHDFGWRQVVASVLLVATVAGVGVTTVDVLSDGWARADDELLPAFVTQAGQEEEFRVLTLADSGGRVNWDLVAEQGPTMVDWAVPFSPGLEATLDAVVEAVVAQTDPAAAGRLGLLNIRYVIVPESARSEALEQGLERQFDLLSQPVADGLVYRVAKDAPPVGVTSPDVVSRITATGALPDDAVIEPVEGQDLGTRWVTRTGDEPAVVMVATVETGAWEATADGRPLPAQQVDGLLRFDAPPNTTVVLSPVGQGARGTALVLQLLAVLLTVSLLLRPPTAAVPEDLR
ncbi:glycosyltransferase [Salsipaludibacter albus]|uniref:glycosyltransferase n=1 Tax=Salsipaludibacter albus TaxID=2849650 RepID=UPI001EE493FE|nr:glycosyltransferase family 2 protein [Salsipaludibacter albus]